MSLTRGQLDAETVARKGAWLARAGVAVAALDGSEPALGAIAAYALRQLGVVPAVPTFAQDADLALVDPTQYDALFDLAELRAIETVLGQWDKVEQSFAGNSQKLDQFGARATAELARKKMAVLQQYGIGYRADVAPVVGPPAPEGPNTSPLPFDPIPASFPVPGRPRWGLGGRAGLYPGFDPYRSDH